MRNIVRLKHFGLALAGAALVGVATPAAAAIIVLNGDPVDNVDTNPASVATINAVGPGSINDLNLSLEITGGHMEDWSLEIEHLGVTVLLRSTRTDPFNHIDSPFSVSFGDEAASVIAFENSGTFIPEELLSAFDGLALAGAWNLRILDTFAPGEGDDLLSWSIAADVGVPEPAVLGLLGIGILGIAASRRRKT